MAKNMRKSWVGLVGLALLLLSPSASAGTGQVLPGNSFPITQQTFFLTGTTGDVAGQTGVLLLSEQPQAEQESVNFLAPGIDILGLVQTPHAQSWYSQASWVKTREVVEDSWATLYFQANPQGLAVFTVRLFDVAPTGEITLVDEDEQQFVTVLSSTPVTFHLATTGIILEHGHVLRLELASQTTNTAVVLQYGGATPSALEGLQTRWLDSDADGIADTDELTLGRNPLDPRDELDSKFLDTDKDGLSDAVERNIGTNPAHNDTDGDGFGDGLEVYAGSDPRDPNSRPYDLNHNGLPDVFETTYFNNTTITATTEPCTPGPGCIDPYGDPDGDGCNNLCEAMHGTDPNNADTDGDGLPDGDEIRRGSDPTSIVSVYNGPRAPEPVMSAAFFAVGSSLILALLLRRPGA